MQTKVGGKYHLKLNIGERPIANKYREGKMKRTLKRELKVREIVKRETFEISVVLGKSAALMSGALFQVQVNIDLVRGKKQEECDPSGCYSLLCCLGLDRGMQYLWGASRLLKHLSRQHADYLECHGDRLVYLH
jgi:hypothetical protein